MCPGAGVRGTQTQAAVWFRLTRASLSLSLPICRVGMMAPVHRAGAQEAYVIVPLYNRALDK